MEETVVFFFWLTFVELLNFLVSLQVMRTTSAADLIKYIKGTIGGISPPDWRSVGTPKLPFVSVFPGKNTDTDVIQNENLFKDRKYRQSRWLQAPPGSPFAIKKKCCGSNNSGKVADATRQAKMKPAKEQRSQRHNPRKWRKGQKLWAIRRKKPAPSPPSRPPSRPGPRPPSRAAQQDSVSRLSRAKVESVPRRIYYPQSKSSSINPRPRRAQARATSINIFYMFPDMNDS